MAGNSKYKRNANLYAELEELNESETLETVNQVVLEKKPNLFSNIIPVDTPISLIDQMEEHPFHVEKSDNIDEIIESIKKFGQIEPIIINRKPDGRYEIISGHRRIYALKENGIHSAKSIVLDVDHDLAVVWMVEANLKRKNISISETAWSLRLKKESLERLYNKGHKAVNGAGRNRDLVGEKEELSGRQVERLINLTNLTPELMDKVDKKALTVTAGDIISRLTPVTQEYINEYMNIVGKIDESRLGEIRELDFAGTVTKEVIKVILKKQDKLNKKDAPLKFKYKKYFPEDISENEVDKIIQQLLTQWKETQN